MTVRDRGRSTAPAARYLPFRVPPARRARRAAGPVPSDRCTRGATAFSCRWPGVSSGECARSAENNVVRADRDHQHSSGRSARTEPVPRTDHESRGRMARAGHRHVGGPPRASGDRATGPFGLPHGSSGRRGSRASPTRVRKRRGPARRVSPVRAGGISPNAPGRRASRPTRSGPRRPGQAPRPPGSRRHRSGQLR